MNDSKLNSHDTRLCCLFMNIVRHLLVLFRSATGGAGTLERLCARNIQRGCVAAFRRCANRQKSKR